MKKAVTVNQYIPPVAPITAIILAGGRSSRMKEDKALLSVWGMPLIEKVAKNISPYVHEIIISTQVQGLYDFLPYRVVLDKTEGQGPLMGILCGLEASSNPINFIIACDIPEVDASFLHQLISYTTQYEIVVPVSPENKFEPLFAFYNQSLIPRIHLLLNQGTRKILELYPIAKTKTVPMLANHWFYNLNTAADYHRYLTQEQLRSK